MTFFIPGPFSPLDALCTPRRGRIIGLVGPKDDSKDEGSRVWMWTWQQEMLSSGDYFDGSDPANG